MIDKNEFVSIEIEREKLMAAMADSYSRQTGRDCEVQTFCVAKNRLRGCYLVHPIDTSYFYEVNVK